LPICSPQALAAGELRRLSRETGLAFTLHMPERLDLARLQPTLREAEVRYCREVIDWAGEAGVALVNLHVSSGVRFTLPDRKAWLYERYQEDFVRLLAESFAEIVVAAEARDVRVSIENTGTFKLGFLRAGVDRILSDLPALGLTWDLGHDFRSGWLDRPAFERWPDRLAHMHLHDADEDRDHQALFSGKVDVAGALALAREKGIAVVIEVKTAEALARSVRQLDERGLRNRAV
jgi:sugar phosphate isomerase/epimerase